MVALELVHVVMITIFYVSSGNLIVKPEALEEYKAICNNVTSKPFFDLSMVVRKTWKAYYTWNKKLSHLCPKVFFKYPNNLIIQRIYKAMSGFLKTEPAWNEAVLVMILVPSFELLLFKDPSGIPGRFIAVPNVREKDIVDVFKSKNRVPSMELAMKLVQKGRYLISSDCRNGVTSLSVRQDKRPKRVDINGVAATFNFGDGFPCCVNEPDPEEEVD